MMSLGHGSHGRQGTGRRKRFSFTTGDLVLVKWEDGMVYFAKIKRIDLKREKCTVVFDDKSQDEADFSQIHSGKAFWLKEEKALMSFRNFDARIQYALQ